MKRIASFAAGLLVLSGIAFAPACSEDTPEPTASPDGGGEGGTVTPLGDPAVPCADAQDAVYGDPGVLPAEKGAIIKCNKAQELTQQQVQGRLDALKYVGKPARSGAKVFRVLYRTERGDAANTPGYSAAIVFVPTTPRANNLPIVVVGRGTRGQAPNCVISTEDPSTSEDLARLAMPLVGNGYALIIPDLAGYSNYAKPGNPYPTYAQTADIGKATADGSRALKKLYPQLADTTVFVGHSQGGHSVLSALALGESYGAQGKIAGVVTYAPLWLSQRSWGAILDPAAAEGPPGYPFTTYALPNAISVWYHFTQAELLDGPGEGEKLFKADRRALIKQWLSTACTGDYKLLTDQVTHSYKLFEDAFVLSVGPAATGAGTCKADDQVCKKWIARYSADRPHLTGAAATTPILMLYGSTDDTIVPGRMRCAYDRLKEDGVNLNVCYESGPGHSTIIENKGEYVADWIGNLTLGEPAPTQKCSKMGADGEKAITTKDNGENIGCLSPPPND